MRASALEALPSRHGRALGRSSRAASPRRAGTPSRCCRRPC